MNIYVSAPPPFRLIHGRSRVHRFANFRSKTVSQTVFLSFNLPSTAPAHIPIANSFPSDSCFVRPIATAIATHTGYGNPAPIPCVSQPPVLPAHVSSSNIPTVQSHYMSHLATKKTTTHRIADHQFPYLLTLTCPIVCLYSLIRYSRSFPHASSQ